MKNIAANQKINDIANKAVNINKEPKGLNVAADKEYCRQQSC